MPKKPEKVLLHYCESCKQYSKGQLSQRMLKRMQQQNADTWIKAKLCEECAKKKG